MSAANQQLFNALNGVEVKEIILRKIRAYMDDDNNFRHHITYPNVQFTFTMKMKYEPGQEMPVSITGRADVRDKIQAQADVIARFEERDREATSKVDEIDIQLKMLIDDLEAKKNDLADANAFIAKLHAEKLELTERLKARTSPLVEAQSVAESLAAGEPIELNGESEVLDEPDRLRDEGVTEKPEGEEFTFSGGGEAQGEVIGDTVTIGKPPSALVLADDSGKAYDTSAVQPRGTTISSKGPGMGAAPPDVVVKPQGRADSSPIKGRR